MVSDLTFGMAGEDFTMSGSVNGTFQGPTRATTAQLAIPTFHVTANGGGVKALAEVDSTEHAVKASLSVDCNPSDGAPGAPNTWQKQDCSVMLSMSDTGVQQLRAIVQVGWANSAMDVGRFNMNTTMTYKDGDEQKSVAASVPSLKWTYGDAKGSLSMVARLATKEDLYGFALTAVEWDKVADRLTYTGTIDPGQKETNKINLAGDFQWFGNVEDGFRSGNCAVETTPSNRHCVDVGYRNDVVAVAGQTEKRRLELSLHVAVAEMDETLSLTGHCDDRAEYCNGQLTLGSAATVNIKHISTDKVVMDASIGNVPGLVERSRRSHARTDTNSTNGDAVGPVYSRTNTKATPPAVRPTTAAVDKPSSNSASKGTVTDEYQKVVRYLERLPIFRYLRNMGRLKQWTDISLDCNPTCKATVASGKEGASGKKGRGSADFKLVVGDTRRIGVDDDTLYFNFKVTDFQVPNAEQQQQHFTSFLTANADDGLYLRAGVDMQDYKERTPTKMALEKFIINRGDEIWDILFTMDNGNQNDAMMRVATSTACDASVGSMKTSCDTTLSMKMGCDARYRATGTYNNCKTTVDVNMPEALLLSNVNDVIAAKGGVRMQMVDGKGETSTYAMTIDTFALDTNTDRYATLNLTLVDAT